MREATCIHCGVVFVAQRSTAKFCGPTCRKGQSRSETQPTLRGSPTKRRENIELFGYHYDLSATYYALQPADRPVWLRNLIERARQGDTKVKRVLTNRVFLRPREYAIGKATYSEHLPTVAQEAHTLCKYMWNAGVEYVIDHPDHPTHAERVEKDRKKLYDSHQKLLKRCLKKLPKLSREYSSEHAKLACLTAIISGGQGPTVSDEHRARWGLV